MAITHRVISDLKVPYPVMTIINNSLKASGYKIRLIRGRGYYYFIDAPSSTSIPVMWLDKTERDLRLAFEYTVEAIQSEDLDPSKFVTEFKRRVEKHQP